MTGTTLVSPWHNGNVPLASLILSSLDILCTSRGDLVDHSPYQARDSCSSAVLSAGSRLRTLRRKWLSFASDAIIYPMDHVAHGKPSTI